MGGYLSSGNKSDPAAAEMALEKAKEIVSNEPVVVFRSVSAPLPSP